MPQFERFSTDVKSHINATPGMATAFREIIAEKFQNLPGGEKRLNNDIVQIIAKKCGYIVPVDSLSRTIIDYRSDKGSIIHGISLYLLTVVDDDFSSLRHDVEFVLFGEGKRFETVYRWWPIAEDKLAAQLGENNNPFRLRLTEPGFHNHTSHFSRRTIDKLIGRKTEEGMLKKFVGPYAGFRWLQLAGAGGQGKSRMAYDLMRHVGDDWERGFLEKEALEEFQGRSDSYLPDRWRNWQPTKPHLIIIDHIIGSEADIGYAMDHLADHQHRQEFKVPVCVLLIERQRWDRGASEITEAGSKNDQSYYLSHRKGLADWFVKLDRLGRHRLASSELCFENGVIELSGLAEDSLVQIVRSLSEISIDISDDFIQETLFRIEKSRSPLFAYFIAEAFQDGSYRPDWGKPELLRHVFAEHCHRYWSSAESNWGECPKLSEDHPALRLAVLATINLWVDCRSLSDHTDWGEINSETKRQALALTGGYVDGGPETVGNIIIGLQPDILGYWFVINAIEHNPYLRNIIQYSLQLNSAQLSIFTMRLLDDFPNHSSVDVLLDTCPIDPVGKMGDSHALFMRADLFSETGENEKAFHLYKRSAEAENVIAMEIVGNCYQAGFGVDQDDRLAIKWLERSVEYDSTCGMIGLGHLYSKEGPYKDDSLSFKWYFSAANRGDDFAIHNVALFYYWGIVVDRNIEHGIELFNEAADKGNADSKYYLGCFAYEGIPLKVDYKRAFEFFEEAANYGHVKAMTNLAMCYQDGKGVEQNLALAIEWFEKAAAALDEIAMVNLAKCYAHGIGVEKCMEKANFWADRAFEAGYKLPED